MTEKILCVDDEILILSGFQRHLRKQFQISSALGGEQALTALATSGPFAVVVSDLKMPGMDGIHFLAKVREISPDSVRVMLTGQADLTAAVAAVNEGSIFRFLTKPCPIETFAQTLTAGIAQHKLIVAERELLENTLRGTVKVLTEILAIVHPAAFGRSSRVRHWVRTMAASLNLKDQWSFELAALLSQIGCVTLPVEVLEKACSGEELSTEEAEIFGTHPAVGARLIRGIPRLEIVAQMVERQQASYGDGGGGSATKEEKHVRIGAQLLTVALDFDHWLSRGLTHRSALDRMCEGNYNPRLLSALAAADGYGSRWLRTSAFVKDLAPSMIVDEDVRSCDGALLMAKGLEISAPLLECLRRYAANRRVREPLQILYESQIEPLPDVVVASSSTLV